MLVALAKNAVTHFDSLKSNVGFKEFLHKFLIGCNSADLFNHCCDNVAKIYKMKENKDFLQMVQSIEYDTNDVQD